EEAFDGFRTDALQAEQLEQRRGERGRQFLAVRRVPALDDLADPLCEVLADPRQPLQRRVIQFGHARGLGGNRVGGVAVRADLERVVGPNLQHTGGLAEQTGDRDVFHGRRDYNCRAASPPAPCRRVIFAIKSDSFSWPDSTARRCPRKSTPSPASSRSGGSCSSLATSRSLRRWRRSRAAPRS